MRMLKTMTVAMAVAAGILAGASAARATVIFESDMSNFTTDFWSGIPFTQNATTVDLLDPGGWATATAKQSLAIDTLSDSTVTLTLAALASSTLQVRLGYYDASDAQISQVLLGAVGGLDTTLQGSDLADPPPVGATAWRLKLALVSGTAELDNLVVVTPEPRTAVLMALGLVSLGMRRRALR